MMAETAAAPAKVEKRRREGLFSKKYRKYLVDPINDNNPITVQILGICSALAVTVKLEPAIVMTLAVIFVTAFSNLIISLLRNTIPFRIRMIVQLVVIASLVIIVDQVLKAFAYDVSKQLSVFVGLIITNCIIMGRLEAFAMSNAPWPSFLDGVGNGLGYGAILIITGAVRELFGSGTLLGWQVVPPSFYEAGYLNFGLGVMPPAALLVVGTLVWLHRAWNRKLIGVS